jgi:enterochelin esterase-like enzyme
MTATKRTTLPTEVPYVRSPDRAEPSRYAYGPDSAERADVPRGTIEAYVWNTSRIFPGTNRRYWVYVPFGYTPEQAVSLMVFQDGGAWVDPSGAMRTTVVFDNLIHRGDMPLTIGVFVDPGIFDTQLPARLPWNPKPANRAAEYDRATDAYAEFLLTEILPEVQKRYRIATDPSRWAIGGMSSGASCAFTAAWQRPDRFRRVLSYLGSYAQIEGGNPYPDLLRDTPPKPLRVFLQTATNDINHDAADRNWFSTNLTLAAHLAERGYNARLVVGDGGHDPNHPGVLLPDALRWLWQ